MSALSRHGDQTVTNPQISVFSSQEGDMDFVAGILSPFLIGLEPGGVLAFTHGCGIRKFEIRCNGYTKLRRVHVTQILFFFFLKKKTFWVGERRIPHRALL